MFADFLYEKRYFYTPAETRDGVLAVPSNFYEINTLCINFRCVFSYSCGHGWGATFLVLIGNRVSYKKLQSSIVIKLGQCHDIFDPCFWSRKNEHKRFRENFRFRKDIREIRVVF